MTKQPLILAGPGSRVIQRMASISVGTPSIVVVHRSPQTGMPLHLAVISATEDRAAQNPALLTAGHKRADSVCGQALDNFLLERSRHTENFVGVDGQYLPITKDHISVDDHGIDVGGLDCVYEV